MTIRSAARPDTLERAVDAIVTSLKPDQIILFGSGARGELRDESDLDLLVIKETDDREQDEPVILPHGERDVDMLVSTKDSAEAARQYAGDVRGKALETGVTVYTREGFTPIETGPALVPQGKKVVRRTLYKPDHARDFLAWIIQENADLVGDTGATVWYKRSAHNVLATTEAPA